MSKHFVTHAQSVVLRPGSNHVCRKDSESRSISDSVTMALSISNRTYSRHCTINRIMNTVACCTQSHMIWFEANLCRLLHNKLGQTPITIQYKVYVGKSKPTQLARYICIVS